MRVKKQTGKGRLNEQTLWGKNNLFKKWILGIDNGFDLIRVLEEEISRSSLTCCLDKANNYKEASTMIVCWTYDLVVLDPYAPKGFELLKIARLRNLPVALFTEGEPSLEARNQLKTITGRNGKELMFLNNKSQGGLNSLDSILDSYELPWWSRFLEKIRFNF